MGYRMGQITTWLLLLGAIVLGILVGMAALSSASATAALRQSEEAPGKIVFQSRQSFKDQDGHSWQIIAFKRLTPGASNSLELRLVGFPGTVAIDHGQPLVLINSLGKLLTATDDSATIFQGAEPAGNVGQYNLQPLLPDLPPEIPLKLMVPTLNHAPVRLSIPPELIAEWQIVAEQERSGNQPT